MIMDENLANYIFPVVTAFCDFWSVGCMASLKSENLPKYKETLSGIIQSLDASMFTDKQIEMVKKSRIHRNRKALESGSYLCKTMASGLLSSNAPLDHEDKLLMMSLVNRDSIQRCIDMYIKKSNQYSIGLVPEKSGIKADDLLLPLEWEKGKKTQKSIRSGRPDRLQEFAPGKTLYTSEAKHKEFTSLCISWKGGHGIEDLSEQGIAYLTGLLLGTETVFITHLGNLSHEDMLEMFTIQFSMFRTFFSIFGDDEDSMVVLCNACSLDAYNKGDLYDMVHYVIKTMEDLDFLYFETDKS